MMVLIDTSIWSLLLRRTETDLSFNQRRAYEELVELVQEGRAHIIGPIRQELLSGIRSPQQFTRLRDDLRAFDDLDLISEDYEEAAAMHNRCRSAGISGSPIDFLICAVTWRLSAAIFTADTDFNHYRRHLPIRLHHIR
jgi:predicted nucleic acid-binding protein